MVNLSTCSPAVNWKGSPEEFDFQRIDYDSFDENDQAKIFPAASTWRQEPRGLEYQIDSRFMETPIKAKK